MALSNPHSNIDLSRLPLTALPFETGLLELSVAALTQYKNISALKRAFGIRLTDDELIMELKDTHTQTHRYLSEIVLTFIAFLYHDEEQRTLENEAQKITEIKIEEEEELEAHEKKEKDVLNRINEINLKEAAARLHQIQEQGFISVLQKLQAQKINELAYWLGKAPDDQARKTLYEIIQKGFEFREQGLEIAQNLECELQSPEITSARRAEIETRLENYYTHLRLADPETRERMIPHIVNAPEKVVQAGKQTVVIEEFATEMLQKPTINEIKAVPHNSNPDKWHDFDLAKNLGIYHGAVAEKFPEALSDTHHNDILHILDMNKLQSKHYDPDLQTVMEGKVNNLHLSMEHDSRFKTLCGYLKNWLSFKMPLRERKRKVEVEYNKIQKTDLNKTTSAKNPSGLQSPQNKTALPQEKSETMPSPKQFHQEKQVQRNSLEAMQGYLPETKSNYSNANVRVSELNREHCQQLKLSLLQLSQSKNLKAEAREDLEIMTKIMATLGTSETLPASELNTLKNTFIARYNQLAQKHAKSFDFASLEKKVIQLSFIEPRKLFASKLQIEKELGL